jgi:hypothetical protein
MRVSLGLDTEPEGIRFNMDLIRSNGYHKQFSQIMDLSGAFILENSPLSLKEEYCPMSAGGKI